MSFSLSYVISTKNRLDHLKILFAHLLPLVAADEEIVVIDGGSTDGAIEYLQKLHSEGKIHQFISEPDRNQAEGWNKALLMAKGTIIKKLIDDDVYCFTTIRKCRDFMLQNSSVDLCISNVLNGDLSKPMEVNTATRLPQFEDWKNGSAKAFTFSDVSMLIRRSSLSFIGLYDTQFRMIDWEYALRASYLKAKIAYYTGFNAMAVDTPGNVTSGTDEATRKREADIGRIKYGYPGDQAGISRYSKVKIWVGKTLAKLGSKENSARAAAEHTDANLEDIYTRYYQTLEAQHLATGGKFIV
ncbi:MAG TPA: glycosyltransferase [Mucilaginibacter sp.]|jgi:glycosyltransferase involved in cell wall biosynthesis|nr:glycosyltransferase [Mucilaginibacter sp.]